MRSPWRRRPDIPAIHGNSRPADQVPTDAAVWSRKDDLANRRRLLRRGWGCRSPDLRRREDHVLPPAANNQNTAVGEKRGRIDRTCLQQHPSRTEDAGVCSPTSTPWPPMARTRPSGSSVTVVPFLAVPFREAAPLNSPVVGSQVSMRSTEARSSSYPPATISRPSGNRTAVCSARAPSSEPVGLKVPVAAPRPPPWTDSQSRAGVLDRRRPGRDHRRGAWRCAARAPQRGTPWARTPRSPDLDLRRAQEWVVWILRGSVTTDDEDATIG